MKVFLCIVLGLSLSGCMRDYTIERADGTKVGTLTVEQWLDSNRVAIKNGSHATIYQCHWMYAVCYESQ